MMTTVNTITKSKTNTLLGIGGLGFILGFLVTHAIADQVVAGAEPAPMIIPATSIGALAPTAAPISYAWAYTVSTAH